MQSQGDEPTGYGKKDIDRFAKLATGWSNKQDVFVFFISGAKERNPAAAMALQAKLGIAPKLPDEPALVKKAVPKRAAAKKAPAKKK
jgi:uncharacterized protein YecE (DUF72 family)